MNVRMVESDKGERRLRWDAHMKCVHDSLVLLDFVRICVCLCVFVCVCVCLCVCVCGNIRLSCDWMQFVNTACAV